MSLNPVKMGVNPPQDCMFESREGFEPSTSGFADRCMTFLLPAQ